MLKLEKANRPFTAINSKAPTYRLKKEFYFWFFICKLKDLIGQHVLYKNMYTAFVIFVFKNIKTKLWLNLIT